MHDPRSNRMAILALMLGAPTLMAPTLTPPSLPGNRAPEEPALGSIEIADAEIAGDISACADLTDFGPCSLRVALFAADADVLADPPLQSATVNAGADGPDWSFSGLSAETAYQLVAYASDGDATVYSGPVAVATRDALPIPPRVAHPGIEPENRYAGFLEGAFDVSLDGSAGYEIQIAVPPGTAGLEPALAFTYDSRSGNGTLGMGFALTGLSEIGRCPPNLFVQGIVDPIDFDDNDVFCLDGEPLVAVRGAYGAHETEYRTVLESFAKIVSYGGAGTDPDWFRVWTKGGRILDYGHSVDSRLEVEGRSEARLWAVNQIGDRFGNTMTVSYFEDPALGEHWPWRIDYTGNEAAGVAPYNQIAFEYSGSVDAPRPDPIRGFFAGGRVENPRRLEHVKTYARNADASGVELVFDYQIRYESGAISGRSRIESISQCDARGACLPPTRFLWSDAPGTTSPSRTGDSTPPVSERVIPVIPPTRFRGVWDANANETAPNLHFSGDVNGDGLTDIIRIEFDNPYYGCADCAVGIADVKFGAAIARGDGTYTYTGQDPGITQKFRFNQSKDPWMVGDANGDGRTDIFNVKLIGDRYGPNGYPLIEIGVWTSTGKGTFSGGYTQTNWEAHISLFESSWHEWAVGDADGDGADDVIGVTPQIPYIYADPTHGYDCDNPGPTFVELRVAYGGSDARPAQTTPWLAWPTYGGCSTEFLKDLPASMGRWRAVDLNGDGRVDVVGLAGFPRIDGLYTAFSTDQGFEVVAQPEPFTFTWATESGTPGAPCAGPTIYCWEPETFDNYMTALDMNADGNTDLVFIAERADPLTGADIGTQTFWTWLSRGDGSYQKQYTRTRIPTNYHVGYFLNNYANPPQAQLNSARVHVHDINGDALPDLTILRDYQYPIVLPFAFRRWDLLSRSDGTFEVLPVIQEGSWGATMSGAPLGYNSDMGIAGSEGELSGDVNGDGKLDWIYFSEGAAPRTSGETLLPGIVHTLFADGNDDPSVTQKSDLLVAIRNGADDASVAPRVTEIRYATLAQAPPPAGAPDTRAYSPSSHVSAADPELRDVQDGRSVVAFHSVSDGIGGARSYKHHYWGHREHTGLRESFGFESISVEDVAAGITETTDTLQHFPLQRQPASRTLHAGDVLLERTAWRWSERTLQPGARHSAREDSRVTWLWEPNAGGSAAAFRTEVRDFAYDAYDNVVHDAHYWGDGEIAFPIDGDWSSRSGSMFQEVLTTIHHPADEESWLVSRIARQSVSAQLPDGGAESEIVRTTEFPSYWEHRGAPTGAPARRVDEPTPAADEPWTHRVTHWAYDAFGNAILETLSDSHDAPALSRTVVTQFDSRGQFPEYQDRWSEASVRHRTLFRHEPHHGRLVSRTDPIGPRGVTTTLDYDGLGREVLEARADGTRTTTHYSRCDESCRTEALYAPERFSPYIVTRRASGGPPVSRYHDVLGRVFLEETQGFNRRRAVLIRTEYDVLGRVSRTSRPYYAVERAGPQFTTSTYDILDRVTRVVTPDATSEHGATRYAYAGSRTTVTDPLEHRTTTLQNARGWILEAGDADRVTRYAYDAFGNVARSWWSEDEAGTTVITRYDRQGRKKSLDDPNIGRWAGSRPQQWTYNIFGEISNTIGPLGESTTFTYDDLGRKLGEASLGAWSELRTWQYDEAAGGRGLLAAEEAYVGNRRVSRRRFSYDTLGRPLFTSDEIHGVHFATSLTYDSYGRVDRIAYPSGVMVRNHYDGLGNLTEVRRADESLLWQLQAAEPDGRPRYARLGNGAYDRKVYDAKTGRLAALQVGRGFQAYQQLVVDFDFAGNLIREQDHVRETSATSYAYDEANRLRFVTNGGETLHEYRYDPLGNLRTKRGVGTYRYGLETGSAGPHAATELQREAPGSAARYYHYDPRGNLVCRGATRPAPAACDGTAIVYTHANQPASIAMPGGAKSYFLYDAQYRRIRQAAQSEDATTLTYYVGRHYEKVMRSDGSVDQVHHVFAGGVAVAQIVEQSTSGGTTRLTRFLHRDHLGSIRLVTDDHGAIAQRFTFDPHGVRSVAEGPDAFETTRGFTGHEHLAHLGLVHMNGRVYDPELGRMLSPDPIVQAPLNLQSYNRYSYVMNNPTSYVDPSGYKMRPWYQRFSCSGSCGLIIVGKGIVVTGRGGKILTASPDVIQGIAAGLGKLGASTSSRGIVDSRGRLLLARGSEGFTDRGRSLVDGRKTPAQTGKTRGQALLDDPRGREAVMTGASRAGEAVRSYRIRTGENDSYGVVIREKNGSYRVGPADPQVARGREYVTSRLGLDFAGSVRSIEDAAAIVLSLPVHYRESYLSSPAAARSFRGLSVAIGGAPVFVYAPYDHGFYGYESGQKSFSVHEYTRGQ